MRMKRKKRRLIRKKSVWEKWDRQKELAREKCDDAIELARAKYDKRVTKLEKIKKIKGF